MNDNLNLKESLTQNRRIAEWLRAGKAITSLEALKRFDCMRLASRICDLRKMGMDIIKRRIHTLSGKIVTEYKLNNTHPAETCRTETN